MAIDFASTVSVTAGSVANAISSTANELKLLKVPAFMATAANAATSGNVITWSTIDFDNTGGWVPANNGWTAPVTGIYRFCYWQLANYATAGEYRVCFSMNGTDQPPITIVHKVAANTYQSIVVDQLISLSAGAIIRVRNALSPAALATDNPWNGFCGYLV